MLHLSIRKKKYLRQHKGRTSKGYFSRISEKQSTIAKRDWMEVCMFQFDTGWATGRKISSETVNPIPVVI